MFFIKINQIFLKGQYQSTCIVPNSSFAQDAWNINKRRVLMEIYKEFLRGQYGLWDVLSFQDWWKFCERAIWIKPYCLLWFFLLYPGLENQLIARFKGQYGSSANDTIHWVQINNFVHKDNSDWNTKAILAS